MHPSARDSILLGRTTPLFRISTMVLAALAIAISERSPDASLTLLGVVYSAVVIVSVVALRRVEGEWLALAALFLDVTAISALVLLVPASPLPIWVLYLFPIISAAHVGPMAAALFAGLGGAGYLAVGWPAAGTPSGADLWPLAILVVAALLAISGSAQLLAERSKKRAWQEVALSLRNINLILEPNSAAKTTADELRRALGADLAWLWMRDGDGYSSPYSSAALGEALIAPAVREILTPEALSRLKGGPVEIPDLGEPFSGVTAEAIGLDMDGARQAVLAVGWRKAPRDLRMRREQLRILAPSLAAGLARSREVACSREALRLEDATLRAVTEMLKTLSPTATRESALAAVRATLGASAVLAAPAAETVETAAVEAANGPNPPGAEGGPAEAASDAEAAPAAEVPAPSSPEHTLAVGLGDGLVLVVRRDGPAFGQEEVDWLRQLTTALDQAVERCAEYEQVRAEESMLRATIEAIPAPCSLWAPGGRLLMANRAQRALGDPERIPELRPSLAGKDEIDVTLGNPARTFVPMTAHLSRSQYTVSVLREVTQEREALRAKEELIAMAGHELRSPLTSISGYSQMMARQLAVVQRQVSQINSLIGDFLEASQLDGGQLRLAAEPVDLAELVRMAAERFQGSNEDRRLRLELAHVPALAADASRLAQVLDNLLSNAAKYSPTEEEIVLTLKSDQDRALISVADRGIGIAPEHLPRLFDRFYRVRNSDTEQIKGLGLGLSIVHNIVTAHDGRVWAESAGPGKGSTFWVSLPLPAANVTPEMKPTGTAA